MPAAAGRVLEPPCLPMTYGRPCVGMDGNHSRMTICRAAHFLGRGCRQSAGPIAVLGLLRGQACGCTTQVTIGSDQLAEEPRVRAAVRRCEDREQLSGAPGGTRAS